MKIMDFERRQLTFLLCFGFFSAGISREAKVDESTSIRVVVEVFFPSKAFINYDDSPESLKSEVQGIATVNVSLCLSYSKP